MELPLLNAVLAAVRELVACAIVARQSPAHLLPMLFEAARPGGYARRRPGGACSRL
jgi:hypothetical protein